MNNYTITLEDLKTALETWGGDITVIINGEFYELKETAEK